MNKKTANIHYTMQQCKNIRRLSKTSIWRLRSWSPQPTRGGLGRVFPVNDLDMVLPKTTPN